MGYMTDSQELEFLEGVEKNYELCYQTGAMELMLAVQTFIREHGNIFPTDVTDLYGENMVKRASVKSDRIVTLRKAIYE